MDKNTLRLINQIAPQHGLSVALVTAIVQIESGGNPWASRYEPAFYDRYIAGKPIKAYRPCSEATEARLRATSFGLMQIMGATARETGFDGVFLTELCAPDVGLEWSCRYLAKLKSRYGARGLDAVVAAYNAGSPRPTDSGHWVNQSYVDKIAKAGGFA